MGDYNIIEKEPGTEEVESTDPERHPFLQFLYNPSTNQIIGRTPKSWMQIGIFYLIYYISLATFFLFMINVFLQFIIKNERPLLTGTQSLLNLNPGLGFRPLPDYQSTMIKFSRYDPQSYEPYVQDIEAFLDIYHKFYSIKSTEFAKCDMDAERNPENPERVCKFDLNLLKDCNGNTSFGFPKGAPCVFLKLNNVYGWLPKMHNSTVNHEHALIQCAGMNPADSENMGQVAYYPSTEDGKYGVFNHHFFPFLAQQSYVQPIVAVKFNNVKQNTVVMVECELKNIENRFNKPAHFELLVD